MQCICFASFTYLNFNSSIRLLLVLYHRHSLQSLRQEAIHSFFPSNLTMLVLWIELVDVFIAFVVALFFFSSLPAGRILVCCLRWLTFKKHIECVHLSEQLENSPAEIDIDERFYWYQYERYAGTLYRKRKPYVSNTPVVRCVVSKNNNRIDYYYDIRSVHSIYQVH